MDSMTPTTDTQQVSTAPVAPPPAPLSPPAGGSPIPQPETPASVQTSPVSLKWALLGIGIIVVLAGGILGLLGSNRTKTTSTSAAVTSNKGGVKWPYGPSLPNVMLEHDTLRVNTDETTGEMSIHGQIVFAKHLNTGAECWVLWASTAPTNKVKDRVGTPFPKGNDQLFPPNPPCPKPGGFNTGGGYPAVATRIFGPLPSENEGVLKNPSATPLRYFDLFKIKVPKGTCKLFLNYRSNRQDGVPFYELTLPACAPTPTPTPTPTVIRTTPIPFPSNTPMTADVPVGCNSIQNYDTPTYNNYSTCTEFCGHTSNYKSCNRGTPSCQAGSCRAGRGNPGRLVGGSWYCCVKATCDKACDPSATQSASGCSAGLVCLPKKCPKGQTCTPAYTCQDTSACTRAGNCQCKEQIGVYPSPTP